MFPSLAALDALWQAGLDQDPAAVPQPGELACAYVLRGALRTAGPKWRQGERRPPLPIRPDAAAASQVIARHQVYRVNAHVAQGLIAWAHDQRPLELRFDVPTPRHVLRLQAHGRRCVSLLPDDADSGLQPSPFEFALHDLCHVEKFVDPAHHLGQTGLFARLDAVIDGPAWHDLQRGFDDAWPGELAHVAADMNGSVLFLWAALRRKVQLAAGRVGQVPQQALERLLDALGLDGAVRGAAVGFSVHPDVDPSLVQQTAATLLAFFEAEGRRAVGHG